MNKNTKIDKSISLNQVEERSGNSIISIIKGTLLILVFTFTICLSFSSKFFKLKNSKGIDDQIFQLLTNRLESLSFSMFVSITITSTISYSYFTGLASSLVGMPIVEFGNKVNDISQMIYEAIVDSKTAEGQEISKDIVDEIVVMIYFTMAFSAILLSAVSFFVYSKKLGKYLKNLPSASVKIVLATIGLGFLLDPYESAFGYEISGVEFYKGGKFIFFIISIYAASFLMFVIQKLTGFSYLIPATLMFFVGLFQVLPLSFFSAVIYPANVKKMMSETVDGINIPKFYFDTKFSFSYIKPGIFMKCVPTIITGSLLNCLHIIINVPSYAISTKTTVSLNREFFVQSVGNFISSIFAFPSYFSYSFSFFLFSTGCFSKLSALFGGILLFALSFFMGKIAPFIPKPTSAAIFGYMGISMVYEYFISALLEQSSIDNITLISGVVLGYLIDISFGFIFGIAFTTMIILSSYKEYLIREKTPLAEEVDKSSPIILPSERIYSCKTVKIDYPLIFILKEKIIEDLEKLEPGSVLDLTEVSYVDLDGNGCVIDSVKKFKEKIKIAGSPTNLYTWKLKDYVIFLN